MRKLLLAAVAVVVLVAVVAVVRAVRLPNPQLQRVPSAASVVGGDAVAAQLARAITFATISRPDANLNAGAFAALHAWIDRTYPRAATMLDDTWVDAGRMRTWRGSRPNLAPLVLAAHADVVPVPPDAVTRWTQPPFGGVVTGGYVWGRGALDDKASLIAIMAAVETLLDRGYRPLRTVHLAFGHDEEIGGARGAARMAAHLAAAGEHPYLVLDEGMMLTDGIVPGVARRVALIGTAEKGYLTLELTATAEGGHSSMPGESSAVGRLAAAVARLQARPFPAKLTGPAPAMLRWLAPAQGFAARLAAANMPLFEPLLLRALTASPAGNALVRTTVAPTMLDAGVKENVLPSQARAVINLRLLPGTSIAAAIAGVRARIADPQIAVAAREPQVAPSPVAPVAGKAFGQLQRSVAETFPDALIAPGLVVGATDARHYARLARHTYRFLPLPVGPSDLKRFHGVDERVRPADLERAVTFYTRLILNTTQ